MMFVVGILCCWYYRDSTVNWLVIATYRLTDILKVVNVCNPIYCSTAERCVLTYLYDIYTTCAPLQVL